ncbi:MAG TPA: hypothetical protein VMM84_03485, partial [Pyrinomonadaceae bacterium]|nr:hypothetical protein [Pyrinomonadaceae bacterium]
ALRRMVLKIRELRPDVIITNHNPTGGHGHHQATGRLLEEAFDAAADPKRFPEQLQKLTVWQTQRLFVRFGFRPEPASQATDTREVITVNPNERDPIRATTFAEQALAALRLHATQGPWPKTVPAAGARLIRYRLVRKANGSAPLPNAASTFVDGLALPESLRFTPPTIEGRLLTEFLDNRERLLDKLIEYRRTFTVSGAEAHRLRLLAKRLDHALAVASGIKLDVKPEKTQVLVPAVATSFLIGLSSEGARPVQIHDLKFATTNESRSLKTAKQLAPGSRMSVKVDQRIPKNVPITVPRTDHLYDGLLFGHGFEAVAHLEIDGAKFLVRDETRLQAAPAVTIESVSPSPYVTVPATVDRPLSLEVTVTNNLSKPFRGSLKLVSPELNIPAVKQKVALEPHQTRMVELKAPAQNNVKASVRRRTNHPTGLLTVSLEQPESNNVVTERTIRALYNNARVAEGLKVGYLPSFDNTLETSLRALAVQATPLTVVSIKKEDLSTYQTIIIDNRGYEAHPDLITANARLLDYVRAGGTLIVFYHKSNEWNPDPGRGRPQLAPYPLMLGSARVTEEDAKVSFLQPEHRLLNVPNRIGPDDFDNWVQERGLYYPREWDERYQALLATNDKGEAALRGGLLVTRYGEGTYIYTSMVWYRQLRAGVPGAYRFFANMISFGSEEVNKVSGKQ